MSNNENDVMEIVKNIYDMKNEFNKISIEDFSKEISIDKLDKEWFLITAEKDGVVNTMTASWGTIGVIWNKPVFMIYVRPQRHTTQFLEASDEFTVTFFDGYKKELSYLGTVSGKDENKIEKVGFEIEYLNGKPTFKQGNLVATCKVLYKTSFEKDSFLMSNIVNEMYQDGEFNFVYIGEIIESYKK